MDIKTFIKNKYGSNGERIDIKTFIKNKQIVRIHTNFSFLKLASIIVSCELL